MYIPLSSGVARFNVFVLVVIISIIDAKLCTKIYWLKEATYGSIDTQIKF